MYDLAVQGVCLYSDNPGRRRHRVRTGSRCPRRRPQPGDVLIAVVYVLHVREWLV